MNAIISSMKKPEYACSGDLVVVRPEKGKTLWSLKEVSKRGGTDFDHVSIHENRTATEARAFELAKITAARVWIVTMRGKLTRVQSTEARRGDKA